MYKLEARTCTNVLVLTMHVKTLYEVYLILFTCSGAFYVVIIFIMA